ncbi:MAG: acylneuraminate cytidylyltransferase family protein [Reichenbachiella sp.]
MNRLVIIPARGGSKGVPGKNIKLLNGKPLIQYTIEAAREFFDDENIIVSTDSLAIKEIVENIGLKVPFLRPKELATDTSGTQEVLAHAIDFYEKERNVVVDQIILLQPTSPFRSGKHIKEALSLYNDELDMIVSVKETKSNPYYVLFEESKDGRLRNSKVGQFTRRQDCPKVWEYNGAIYVINKRSLEKKGFKEFDQIMKYVMDENSSVDIDSLLDWRLAESILRT